MDLLLENGADVEKAGLFNSSPLVWAAMGNQPQAVEILLEKGADLDKRNKEGKTALMIARERNFSDIVDMLEQCPIDRQKKKDDLLEKSLREERLQRVRAAPPSKLVLKKNGK
jgi:ankyrin repeat protein